MEIAKTSKSSETSKGKASEDENNNTPPQKRAQWNKNYKEDYSVKNDCIPIRNTCIPQIAPIACPITKNLQRTPALLFFISKCW